MQQLIYAQKRQSMGAQLSLLFSFQNVKLTNPWATPFHWLSLLLLESLRGDTER